MHLINLSEIYAEKIFDVIRNIKDPEHPQSLEDLKVVKLKNIFKIKIAGKIHWRIVFTPTIPHCSLASIIGLCIIYKINKSIKLEFNSSFSVEIEKGSHVNDDSITKQLVDKDRVRAAFENYNIKNIIDSCV